MVHVQHERLSRFLDRVYALGELLSDEKGYSSDLEKSFHKTVKKVSEDIEGMKFNTAIAAMMSLINEIYAKGRISRKELETFLTLLNPFAPHITEELWEKAGFEDIIARAEWPSYDENKTVDDEIEIPVQINGKLKAVLKFAKDIDKDAAINAAKTDEKIAPLIDKKTIVKEIFVPGKMINFVIK